MKQQRIFNADDGQDLLSDCALSGEPLIQTMSPETDAHEYALDAPLMRTIIGERKHLTAYEVRLVSHLREQCNENGVRTVAVATA